MTYFIYERFESFEKDHYAGVITLIIAKHLVGIHSLSVYVVFMGDRQFIYRSTIYGRSLTYY